jgi:hypothetical protein
MKWWVRLRLDIATPPLWLEEFRKGHLSQLSQNRLALSKHAIIKHHVKHITAMLMCRHDAEGWTTGRGDPLGPLPGP